MNQEKAQTLEGYEVEAYYVEGAGIAVWGERNGDTGFSITGFHLESVYEAMKLRDMLTSAIREAGGD